MVKNPPAKWETCTPSLGWEDSLEENSHFSILAWKIAMGLQSMGSQKVHATKHTARTDLVKDQKLKWGFSG